MANYASSRAECCWSVQLVVITTRIGAAPGSTTSHDGIDGRVKGSENRWSTEDNISLGCAMEILLIHVSGFSIGTIDCWTLVEKGLWQAKLCTCCFRPGHPWFQ